MTIIYKETQTSFVNEKKYRTHIYKVEEDELTRVLSIDEYGEEPESVVLDESTISNDLIQSAIKNWHRDWPNDNADIFSIACEEYYFDLRTKYGQKIFRHWRS